METIAQNNRTRLLQVPGCPISILKRLRVQAAKRDLRGVGKIVIEILDMHLPPLDSSDASGESEVAFRS